MKKITLLVLLSIVGTIVQAQGVLTLPDFNSGKTIWFIRAGASLSGVTGSAVDAQEETWGKGNYSGDFSRQLGGNIMIGFNKSFGHSPIYFGMELGAGMRGYKMEAEKSNSGSLPSAGNYRFNSTTTEATELNAFNAQFSPINIGYKYKIKDILAVDVHVGGFASYDFAGKLKSESTYNMTSTSKHGSGSQSKDNSNSVKIKDIDSYTNYDFGVTAGVGVWVGHINLDFTWERGFVSIYEGDNDLFCNAIQLRLGYAF